MIFQQIGRRDRIKRKPRHTVWGLYTEAYEFIDIFIGAISLWFISDSPHNYIWCYGLIISWLVLIKTAWFRASVEAHFWLLSVCIGGYMVYRASIPGCYINMHLCILYLSTTFCHINPAVRISVAVYVNISMFSCVGRQLFAVLTMQSYN
jgi:hypothetical protein